MKKGQRHIRIIKENTVKMIEAKANIMKERNDNGNKGN